MFPSTFLEAGVRHDRILPRSLDDQWMLPLFLDVVMRGRAAVSRMHRTNRVVYESVTRLKKLEWLSPPTKNISSDVG